MSQLIHLLHMCVNWCLVTSCYRCAWVGSRCQAFCQGKKPLIINLHLMKTRLMQSKSTIGGPPPPDYIRAELISFPCAVRSPLNLFYYFDFGLFYWLISLIICKQSVVVPLLPKSLTLADSLLFLSIFPLPVSWPLWKQFCLHVSSLLSSIIWTTG